ncbi:serine/threonine protein kinase [Thermosporothrix hazakensis]|jgi:serine/threonine protein kinase|uniref:non-specific serine/threonine protein kinase n=1 Tax=Thermosporothrix hazakensis TaxID=644383 RepID=A0A326U6Y6_THEHA|nr:serine/threonine-protein kinase [Thermosporothrix hazakensis]PZW26367.1 serine/threonine protein kinase [Thermosporothrix hazakensis]GCE48681.1 hypothetical protein KTH_35500 [Thermosporothrix hazakensis]
MNAEALVGTVLGTCTLQKLVGQGGMGAVYLAQQSRPRRQVAVKVLMPLTPLNPKQLAAFLERFRRETDAAASLEHPNIVPVHEYGERDGIAYLVMPYIDGGTLRDEMEQMGQFPFDKTVNYLEQLAAALDFAHENGVIHRDIKPANIMMTRDKRLLLSDFGLVKINVDGRTPLARLTGEGVPVGTPDYMAPEQVIGEDVDARADLYSLGVILYQMVTGTTPFQGEVPMQIAAQHLQIPPPSPLMLRPDLPIAAEQVILRSLAKRPNDRYSTAQELAASFRNALEMAGIELGPAAAPVLTTSTGRIFVPKGVIESGKTSTRMPAVTLEKKDTKRSTTLVEESKETEKGQFAKGPALTLSSLPAMKAGGKNPGGLLSRASVKSPTAKVPATPAGGGGLLSRTGKFPLVGNAAAPNIEEIQPEQATTKEKPFEGALFDVAPIFDTPTEQKQTENQTATQKGATGPLKGNTGALNPIGKGNTGAMLPIGTGNTGALNPGDSGQMVKLSGPAKVVKVPVPGQPGRYMTGILPVIPPDGGKDEGQKKRPPVWMTILAAIVAIAVLGGGSLFFLQWRNAPQQGGNSPQPTTAVNSPEANATATAVANILFEDPLDTNRHNWIETPKENYAFKDGAYHITNTDQGKGKAALLETSVITGSVYYSLSMNQIKGDTKSDLNTYGMMFRFTQGKKGNKDYTAFYTFEVVNKKDGEYKFWKYDSSTGTKENHWTQIGKSVHFGKEFQQGLNKENRVTVFMDGKKFVFSVNGKEVMRAEDGSLSDGSVGMFVNQKGAEVAFKNLRITRSA